MIDERRLAALSIDNTQSRELEDVLGKMSEDDLWELRELIDSCLPSAELAQMNLTKELTIQYRRVLRLQEEVLRNGDVAANQKAQVAAQVKSTLQDLVDMQTKFYTAERFRSIENMVVDYMKSLPLSQAKDFLEKYEQLGNAET